MLHGEEVHQCNVLHILRERSHQWWVAHARPYVFNLVEQAHEHIVGRQLLVATLAAYVVYGAHDASEVGHHRAHHASGQSAAQQERRHVLVAGVDEVAQPLVDELLCERACLHVGAHVDVGHVEALVAQHRLH